MPKIQYIRRRFQPAALKMIAQANAIIEVYRAQGFRLTVRQLYYQFVSKGLLANTVRNYGRLASLVNKARLNGDVDWDAIEDRTRNLSKLPHWVDPPDILTAVAEQFRIDKWASQPYRIEVWIEKEALAGVFEGVCQEERVPFFCCRGYTSQSEMWSAAMRLIAYTRNSKHQKPVILHFGDHDPSGIDMTRDITERLEMFGCPLILKRLALNMDQVKQYNPPPNPAKEVDPRFVGYLNQYGDESWELDALEPRVLADLVRGAIKGLRSNKSGWKKVTALEEEHKKLLKLTADEWSSVSGYLQDQFE